MGKAIVGLNKPNETRYFYPADDNREMRMLPMKASTALAEWAVIGIEIAGNTTTGYATLFATENASWGDFLWIMAEPVVSTDTDYATAGKLKWVRVPKTPLAKAFFAVWAGTFTAADVFKTVEITAWSLWLSVDTAGKWARIVEYISSSRWVCIFTLPTTETA